jgi:hypothetical protein
VIVSFIRDGDGDSNLDNCNAVQQLKLLKKFFDKKISSKNMVYVLTRKVTQNFYQLLLEQLKMNK